MDTLTEILRMVIWIYIASGNNPYVLFGIMFTTIMLFAFSREKDYWFFSYRNDCCRKTSIRPDGSVDTVEKKSTKFRL